MKRTRLLHMAGLGGAALLLLTACFPRQLTERLPGDASNTSTGETAMTIQVTPLSPRVFGATTAPTSSTPAPDAALATALSPANQAAPSPTGQSSARDFDAEVPAAWFDLANRLARDEKLVPPVAARLFGYAGVALYEAVAPGMPGYQSLAGQLNDLPPLPQPDPQTSYHWPTVANAALATLFRTMAANASGDTQRAIADQEKQFTAQFASTVAPDVLQRSIAQGQLIGLAIFTWAQADGFAYLNNCTTIQPSGDGLWTATPPNFAAPLQPCWGQMRPFVLRERSDECQPTFQPVYSERTASQFYLEALEVYQTAKNLTPEQREIALYWSDDVGKSSTPPGHTMAVLTQIVRGQNLALDAAAEAYARLGIAVADAFISCWQTKFRTNVPRPVTTINKVIDPAWMPLLTTPPFPEYTSGHSAQSGAAATVLAALFGEDLAITDHSKESMGYAPRSFNSFREMANEAAISRLYGGIHYRSAIEVGLEQGACIGARVNALRFRK